ncbi:MAG: hypothetical protein HOV71_18230 [Hamadaea sp.]|nr:hypothetical protein [Hamadaea sp.]NUR50066.1 hypothetical protein [Hamadaea sp.]NUT05003.1 hypothetical protein [Hamadaea sp.]
MARRNFPLVLATCAVIVGVGLVGTAVYAKLDPTAKHAGGSGGGVSVSPSPTKSPEPPPPPTLNGDQPVTVTTPPGGFFAWAFYDRRTGKMTGSANSATKTNSTESMIKTWLVSDYLRRLGAKEPTTSALNYVKTAIINSNDTSATWLYKQDGGSATIGRMIKTCGLKNTKANSMGWAYTTMTAQDAVRLGLCVGDGRAAGEKWTDHVLSLMKQVQGTTAAKDQQKTTGGGHWGIIDGLPKNLVPETSIKNGWTMLYKDVLWHVNCLAVHDDWVLAVQVRIKPVKSSLGQKDSAGLAAAAKVCATVAKQLTYQPPAPAA